MPAMIAIHGFSIVVLGCSGLMACDVIYGKELNPDFCAAYPEDTDCFWRRCNSTAQCPAPLVCDVGGMNTCVECTKQEASACTGITPVCDFDSMCRGCAVHTECSGSEVCLPDGTCADPVKVAYVKPPMLGGTENLDCTLMMPCTKVASALVTARPYIKIAGVNDEGGTVTFDNRNVMLLAERAARLTRTSPGLHVEVKGTSQVEINDLEIGDALGSQGVGISMPPGNTAKLTLRRVKLLNNAGGAITMNGGMLIVSQSEIVSNLGGGISANSGMVMVSQSTIYLNAQGGIDISNANFVLTNNLIAENGSETASFGGVRLNQTNVGTREFEFNTVACNSSMTGVAAGVVCNLVEQQLTLSNSIVYHNQFGDGQSQIGGANCSWTYSNIGPEFIPGIGNINGDPMFADDLGDRFRLQWESPARDAADPTSTLAIDIDGSPRPHGMVRDMGADELNFYDPPWRVSSCRAQPMFKPIVRPRQAGA